MSVYPHVARKCCNLAKSTALKRQHVITKIPVFVSLVSLVLLAAP